MPLLYRVNSRAELPAGFESHYTERDGAFVLDVSGAVDKDKLDEFRSNNKALNEQLRELTRRFDGIDPVKARELLAKAQELEDAQLVKAGDVEKLVESRLKKLKTDLEGRLQATSTERDRLGAELAEIRINQKVIEAASKEGLRATAIPDLVSRTRSVFRLVDGQPRAFEADGKTPRLTKEGEPLTLEGWSTQLVAEAPHLFVGTAGSGAVGSGSGGVSSGGVTKNPFKRESWNLTEQMRITKS